jgi:hypothetical protein
VTIEFVLDWRALTNAIGDRKPFGAERCTRRVNTQGANVVVNSVLAGARSGITDATSLAKDTPNTADTTHPRKTAS